MHDGPAELLSAFDARSTSADGPLPPLPDRSRPAPAGPAPEAVPDLDGFRNFRLVGRGGMGTVYAATQTALGREVAVKLLAAAARPHPDALARFRLEARLVARLQHPNVVQVFEVGEANGRPYLVLELVPGGSLAGRLAGGPLPGRAAAELARALAAAVSAVHAAASSTAT